MSDEIADEMKIEFIQAATYGDIDRVRELLDMGVKPNIKIRFNSYTALILASIGGYIDIVRLLLSRDTDPNIQKVFHDDQYGIHYKLSPFHTNPDGAVSLKIETPVLLNSGLKKTINAIKKELNL